METTLTPPRVARRARPWLRATWRMLAVLAVLALALALRLHAVANLPADFDEDDYLRAGQLYAGHMARGDLVGVINERENYEHPPLTKLVFGGLLLAQGPEAYASPVTAGKNDTPASAGTADKVRPLRTFSAVVGALTAALVALINPLAGLLVALNSWHIKYTSEAMLEALPCFFATLTLLLLLRSRRNGDGYFWLAALGLGLTAAGTYRYGAAGFAALAWFWWREPQTNPRPAAAIGLEPTMRNWFGLFGSRPVRLACWLGLALLMFYAFNPALWPNPLGRLRESILFNTGFATGSHVQQANLPWFQPLVWLLGAVPWHPGVFPLLLDGVFGLLALLHLNAEARRRRDAEELQIVDVRSTQYAVRSTQRLIVWWFLANLLFLFFWPTKWPQYILALTVPVSLLAARWLADAALAARTRWRAWRASDKRQTRAALPWLLPGLLFFALVVAYPLLLQTALATTWFNLPNLKAGLPTFWLDYGRGLLGFPVNDARPLPYFGTGAVIYVLGDKNTLPLIRFNVLWVAVTMLLATALGLWLANLLSRRGLRGRSAWQALFILPWAIPEFVGALVWNTLFDDTFGGINALTGMQTKWLRDPTPVVNVSAVVQPLVDGLNALFLSPLAQTLAFVAEGLSAPKAFWVMVLVGVWVCFPFMMLVSLAALRGVPPEVYDAARVDGASGWRLWRSITWPLIRPTVLAGLLLRGALLFNAFYIPQMLIGDTRPTGTATLSYIGYLVMRFDSAYSFAAMINTLVLAVAILLIWLYNRQTRVVDGVER
ncbi:MAG: sugar ABC transporter permease [Chloroflexaceae bacterium]|jgi:ABC-type sugar transport system permease subunit|nr:sugar ABC transporter permease [Chloroflexaceae bacterium]